MKKHLIAPLSSAALLFLQPSPVIASQSFSPLESGFRVMWGLALVLLVMFLLYFLLRGRFQGMQQGGGKEINILEIRNIPPKKSLLLVEVRGQHFLVGAGGDAITVITALQRDGDTSFATALLRSKKED